MECELELYSTSKTGFFAIMQSTPRSNLSPPCEVSGCPVVSVLEAGHCIRLLAFLPLDNVELDFVTFLERFVPVRFNR